MKEGSTLKKGEWKKLLPLAIFLFFVAALYAMKREISHFDFEDFRQYIRSLSLRHLGLAIAATLGSYLALIGYDCFALRYIDQKLEAWKIALTAFIGYAFSMNIGQSILSGGAVRMRMYTDWGIGAGEVTRIIGFNFVNGIVGQAVAGGLLFTFGSLLIPDSVPLPFHSVRGIGILFLLLAAAYFVEVARRQEAIEIRNWRIELPPLRIAVPAAGVAVADWLLAGIVLFALMPEDMGVGMWSFLGIVLLSQVVGLISMVPGGLGVFETVILHLLPESVSRSAALSALIAYRAIYYLGPFILAMVGMVVYEAKTAKNREGALVTKIAGWIFPLVPLLLSMMAFVSGAILLLSGATPAVGSRMAAMQKFLPLFVVESSHFLGSIVGVALLLLSSSLRRRVNLAWLITSILLVAGIATSLLKGLDYEEAIILSIVLAILLLSRQRFDRSAALFSLRFTPGWWLTVGMVVATAIWIGFAAYERVHYHPGMWSHFGFKGDASRFLRASAGIAAAFAGFGIWHLLRPGMRIAAVDELPDDTAKIIPVLQTSESTNASLALLGDKRFIFSKSGHSFIMYGIQGRTWIAMGDVVGDADEEDELVWKFREICDAAGARCVFYQVSADDAHIYAGLGMMLYKLGEEARVSLPGFTLDGPKRKDLRHTKSQIERGGATFEMIPAARFDEFKGELKAVSDEWMGEKNGSEKGFSLGSYREEYLRNFDFAVIKVEGKIVAFSNICKSAGKHELSIDLMRHTVDSPYGAMEYLFIELMLWGKEQGYQWFSLGMAPLSGLENRSLAPVWNRIGSQIFTIGEHFYNFQGLRNYKAKFDPEWEPRYLAYRGLLQLPVVLLDIAALISGGLVQSVQVIKS